MKLIKSSIELIEQAPSLKGLFKHIERCGRTSYQSYDKMDDTSYERFCKMIEQRGHLSVFEHGTVYLKFEMPWDARTYPEVEKYINNPYSFVSDSIYTKDKYEPGERQYSCVYITTNYRVIIENRWQDDLKFMCEPTKFHSIRISIKFICSIGIGREILRHRQFSMIQESTR